MEEIPLEVKQYDRVEVAAGGASGQPHETSPEPHAADSADRKDAVNASGPASEPARNEARPSFSIFRDCTAELSTAPTTRLDHTSWSLPSAEAAFVTLLLVTSVLRTGSRSG